MERGFTPELAVGFFQITDLSVAVNFGTAYDAAVVADARIPPRSSIQAIFILDVEGATVRWRNDGTAPTAAVGNRIIQDTGLVYTANSLDNLQLIQETAGAKLNVAIFKHRV